MIFVCAGVATTVRLLHDSDSACAYGTGLQVIYGVYSAAPPSLWFSPERPVAFGLMLCVVLCITFAAATIHGGLLSTLFRIAPSSAGKQSASYSENAKIEENTTSPELIEMRARAADMHLPLSPAAIVSNSKYKH